VQCDAIQQVSRNNPYKAAYQIFLNGYDMSRDLSKALFMARLHMNISIWILKNRTRP
jgi:hypothetical protein